MTSARSLAARRNSESDPSPALLRQAQERGEHTQAQDEAVYALDGMAPSCSLGTQRDSAASLAELLSTRRGRAALKADGMTQQVQLGAESVVHQPPPTATNHPPHQVLTAAAKLRGQADPAVALACSALLLSLSMPDAHPSYLASSAASVLVSQLLQVVHSGGRLRRVTTTTPTTSNHRCRLTMTCRPSWAAAAAAPPRAVTRRWILRCGPRRCACCRW